MDNVIRFVLEQVGYIAPFILRDHLRHSGYALNYLFTLVISEVGKPLVSGYSLVCKQPYDKVSVFGSFVDYVDEPRMHYIGNHAKIYLLCHKHLYFYVLFCKIQIVDVINLIPLQSVNFEYVHGCDTS